MTALLFASVIAPQVQAANGVVGPGNCNYAGFSSVLATVDGSGGGTITFNCGTATITFAGYKQISNAVVIDGGGTITFDGTDITREPPAQTARPIRSLSGHVSVSESGVPPNSNTSAAEISV